jgi:hypothetical protein
VTAEAPPLTVARAGSLNLPDEQRAFRPVGTMQGLGTARALKLALCRMAGGVHLVAQLARRLRQQLAVPRAHGIWPPSRVLAKGVRLDH